MVNKPVWKSRKGFGLIALAALLLVLAFLYQTSQSVGGLAAMLEDEPAPYDPLSARERAMLEEAVLSILQPQERSAGESEVLLIQRYDGPKSKNEIESASYVRRGEVFVYDYGSDTLRRLLVDLSSGEVESIEESQSTQLPLTDSEKQRALELITLDPAFWSELSARYEQIYAEPLQSVEQLEAKIAVFHGDSMPDRVNQAASACGLHRCAQMLIYGSDRTAFELTPIVDLSTGQIVQVLEWAE